MKFLKILFFIAFSAAALTMPLLAQEGAEGEGQEEDAQTEEDAKERPSLETRWSAGNALAPSKGDGVFNFNVGVAFPALFTVGSASQFSPPVGGLGKISGHYFLSSLWFVGGGVEGLFISSIGEYMFYTVGLGPYIGLELTAGRFEFPFSLTVGCAWEMYIEKTYFGLFVKPAASALYRAFDNWAFGLTAAWWLLPQLGAYKVNNAGDRERAKDSLGSFIELTLMAQYHF